MLREVQVLLEVKSQPPLSFTGAQAGGMGYAPRVVCFGGGTGAPKPILILLLRGNLSKDATVRGRQGWKEESGSVSYFHPENFEA